MLFDLIDTTLKFPVSGEVVCLILIGNGFKTISYSKIQTTFPTYLLFESKNHCVLKVEQLQFSSFHTG